MERGGSNERIVGPQVCQFKYCYQGSHTFLNQKFKDFSKESLSLCFFKLFHNMSNCILKVFLCLLSWIKLETNFKDFPAPTTIFKDFQSLEFLLSR